MSTDRQTDYHSERAGVAAALAAYIFWGLAPIYFKWIDAVAPLEIIAHRILWSIPFLAGFLLLGSAALAPPVDARGRSGWQPARIAPELDAWFRYPVFRIARGGHLPGGPRAAYAMDRVGVTLRLRTTDDLSALLRLEGPGLAVSRHGGRIARLGPIVCARVNAHGLEALRRADWVERVELDMRRRAPRPVEVTAPEIQAPAVGINFDIGHFFCAGEDPAAAFEELARWVGHVHIEDIAPTREHNHLIAGLGAIDFPAVFNIMKQSGYANDMSLELYPYTDRPEEAGRLSLDHLLPMLREAGLQ